MVRKRQSEEDVLYRMTGVDHRRRGRLHLKVLSEIGTDMTKWPSAKHGTVPTTASPAAGHQLQDQGLRQPGRGGAALAANALHRSDSALGAFLRRKKAHLGAPKAITATAHKLACVIYLLRYGQEYVDAGPNITKVSISSGRCARPSVGRPNWELVPMSDGKQQDSLPLNPAAAAV